MGESERARKIERKERALEVRAEREREDRRNKYWIYGTGAVLIFALIASVTTVSVLNQRKKAQLVAAAAKPILGLQSFSGLTRKHTSKEIAYQQNPPMGGDHSPQFINCGIYTHPINNWEAVHSLEHGAVWVTYRTDLPKNQIDLLNREAVMHPYELLSPYPGLSAPVVASAWGKQLKMEKGNDPRLKIFLQAFLQGPQTPEPGAACAGGVVG